MAMKATLLRDLHLSMFSCPWTERASGADLNRDTSDELSAWQVDQCERFLESIMLRLLDFEEDSGVEVDARNDMVDESLVFSTSDLGVEVLLREAILGGSGRWSKIDTAAGVHTADEGVEGFMATSGGLDEDECSNIASECLLHSGATIELSATDGNGRNL